MNRISTVIHKSTDANFTAFTYDRVVVGGVDVADTCVINGCVMNLSPCSSFDVRVTSISGGTNVYLIGAPINIFTGSQTLP